MDKDKIWKEIYAEINSKKFKRNAKRYLEKSIKEEKENYNYLFQNRQQLMTFILSKIDNYKYYNTEDFEDEIFCLHNKNLFSTFVRLFLDYAQSHDALYFDNDNYFCPEFCLVSYSNDIYVFQGLHGQGSIYEIEPFSEFSCKDDNSLKKYKTIDFIDVFS